MCVEGADKYVAPAGQFDNTRTFFRTKEREKNEEATNRINPSFITLFTLFSKRPHNLSFPPSLTGKIEINHAAFIRRPIDFLEDQRRVADPDHFGDDSVVGRKLVGPCQIQNIRCWDGCGSRRGEEEGIRK